MSNSIGKLAFVCLTLGALLSTVRNVNADNLLLLSTGVTANDLAAGAALQSQGHTVTLGPLYSSSFTPDFSGYSGVVLLQNDSGTGSSLDAAVQTALVNYVNGGGGLLTSDWTNWGMAQYDYSHILQPIMPVALDNHYDHAANITYTQSTADAILNQGLPTSFSFAADDVGGTETYFTAKPGATTFYGSSYGAGVIGWNYGAGRVMSLSTLAGPIELADPNYGLLFSNAATWIQSAAPVPEPSSLALAGLGGIGLAIAKLRRRKAPSAA